MAGTFRRAKITTRVVEALRPGEIVADTELRGFHVRRQKGGARNYFVRKHVDGRRHFLTLGAHGELTVAEARAKAIDTLARLRGAFDPAAERARRRAMPTLAAFAREFIESHQGVLKPGTLANYRSMVRVHLEAAPGGKSQPLGKLPLDRVTRQDLAGLHRRLRATPRAANHLLAFISRLYREAVAQGIVPEGTNPVRGIKRYPERARERFLTQHELAQLGRAMEEALSEGSESPYAVAAIRLLIFTGCRRDEILSLRWEDVDLERGVLTLPDSKTGRRSVMLSAPAKEVLASLPRVPDNAHVIVGARPGARLVNLRKPWLRLCKRAGLEPAPRLHDLRHTHASLLAAGGASLPMIGALLGHSQAQTTRRYAHLADDRLKAAAEAAGCQAAGAMAGETGGEVLPLRREG